MAPEHEKHSERFTVSEDSSTFTGFDEIADSERQKIDARHDIAPPRRGLFTRIRNRMWSWRLRVVDRVIDQPLYNRVRRWIPDWVYTPWGLVLVVLTSFIAIGLWAGLLYVVAF